ncbi:MAG: DUF11 domain-containing protein [Chloroflexi bacterium]|nr:DUF11 domain-containing protein [Chloroflexota bacterium]
MADAQKVARTTLTRVARLALAGGTALALAVVLLIWLGAPASAQAPASGVNVLRSDANGLLIELLVPSYTLQTRAGDAESFVELNAPDLTLWSPRPGYPQLLIQSLLIGAPQDADVVVQVLSEDAAEFYLPHKLAPLPSLANGGLPGADPPAASSYRYAPDPAAYAQRGYTPTESARINALRSMRSQRIAQIVLSPFRYDAAQGRVRWARRMRVEVRFTRPAGRAPQSGVYRDEGVFEPILSSQLLNYSQALAWRQAASTPASTPSRPASAPTPSYRVSIRDEGIYRLTYSDLVSAGIPATVTPSTLQIFKNGVEVPTYLAGDPGVFTSSSFIEFYAQAINTLYSDINIYWLTYGGANGARMATRSGVPTAGTTPATFTATVHAETNLMYDNTHPWGDGDHWFWNNIHTPLYFVPLGWVASPATYTVALSEVNASAPTATVHVQVMGYSGSGGDAYPHHGMYYLNGVYLGEDRWVGDVQRDFTVSFTQSILISGTNVLSVVVPNDNVDFTLYDGIAMNWFEVEYQRDYQARDDRLAFQTNVAGPLALTVTAFSTNSVRLYDVSIPTQAVRLTSPTFVGSGPYALVFGDSPAGAARYEAVAVGKTPPAIVRDDSSSSLKSTANGADYIVIAYDDFYTATAPLETLRASQGLRVARARISDVYDEFSDGVVDATAIRSFLMYAYTNWQTPAPQFVLLVGDGTVNYHNYFPHNIYPYVQETQFIPPYMKANFVQLNETAVDNWYVNLTGNGVIPDMAIGRLPSRSVTETVAMVNKIVAYEQAPPPGAWQSTVGYFADNYYDAYGNPGTGGDFPGTADRISSHIPAYYTATRVYYDPYTPTITGDWFYTTDVATRRAITTALNTGMLFATYIGHASKQQWADERLMGNYLSSINVFSTVANGARQPILLELACQTGEFQLPGYTTLAESFIRADGYGAIADWASSGNGYNTAHEDLATQLYDGVFQHNLSRLGLAINFSKLANSAHGDEVDQFTLFGDPALRINLVPNTDLVLSHVAAVSGTLAAGTPLTFTLRLTNAGQVTAAGVVISDVLPAGLVSVTYVASGAVVTPMGGSSYVWNASSLAPGASMTINVYARTSSYLFDHGTYVLAVAAQASTTAPETILSNNSAVAVAAPPVDLVVTQRAPSIVWVEGGNPIITYTLQYTNVGGTLATNIVISDILPAGLLTPTYSYSGASLSEDAGPQYAWIVSDLSPGGGGTIMIVAQVDASYWLSASIPISVSASIMGALGEVTLANNVTSLSTKVAIPLKSYLPMVSK